MARYFPLAAAILVIGTDYSIADDALKASVEKAVTAGQRYLKAARGAGPGGGIFGRDGGLPEAAIGMLGGNGSGTACLSALALKESGLDAKDPVVAAITNSVRRGFMSTTSTYEISLMIMLLDRVDAKQDEPIIQFLTLRLMSGQAADGSWGYSCTGLQLDPVQTRQLEAVITRNVKLSTPEKPTSPTPKPKNKPRPRGDVEQPKPKTEPKKKEDPPEPTGLHPALVPIAKVIQPGGGGRPGMLGASDHSNTQFATVGLWCGRRHGVEVGAFLKATDKHYRTCQMPDGGWGYTSSGGQSSPSMTCAGLMGLAMGFGAVNLEGKENVKVDPVKIAGDKSLESGLKYLGTFLNAAGNQRDGRGGAFRANELSSNLYFMWSLERVGMVYGLETIGKLDWYDWGARLLVASQGADGSWQNPGGLGTIENATAFALLFLSRSNLAAEVSTSMKGKVKDPGSARLVGGGDLSKLVGEAGKGSTADRPPATGKGSNPPLTPANDKGGKLANALLQADAIERAELLKQYRESKGGEYTDALARAASKMTGEPLAQVREALAQRLTRMTSSTLNDFMRDYDRELRRGAALAAGSKGKDRLGEFAVALIRLIGDDEPMVVQAARASLKVLSGKDFGPDAASAPGDRAKALIAWRNWWESQQK